MINYNNLKDVSATFEDILETPVSVALLEKTTEAQRQMLRKMVYLWTIGKLQKEILVDRIHSVLNFAKDKMEKKTTPFTYSLKASQLRAKGLIK